MAAYILARADSLSKKIALSIVSQDQAENWTYGQLKSAILGTATGLKNAGLNPGDRLLLRLGNTVDFPIVYLAAIAAGIIPVPTSAQLNKTEINQISEQVCPAMVVASPGVVLPDISVVPVLGLSDLRSMRSLPPTEPILGDPNRPAYIIFTSGTAGNPRGVIHAHRAIWARRMMWQGWYGLTQDDRLLHAGAFNWTFTLGTGLMDPWAVGATALIPDIGVASAHLPALLAKHSVSLFAAAPGVFRQILKSEFPALPQLRHGLSAGEKLADETRAQWLTATGTPINEAYGMSECSTFISAPPLQNIPAAALGFPQDGRCVAIRNDSGIAKINQPGVISIHRSDPGLMLGYLGELESFRNDWFATGDIGSMDQDGAITYLGRNDDMMNAGGFRVSPIEVENAMRQQPEIIDCAATETQIKTAVKVITLHYTAKAPINDNLLTAHAKSKLARYKQPRLYQFVASLPMGANGKILRKKLRENPESII